MKRSWRRTALAVGGLTMALGIPAFALAPSSNAGTCVGGYYWINGNPSAFGDPNCAPQPHFFCLPVHAAPSIGLGKTGVDPAVVCLPQPVAS